MADRSGIEWTESTWNPVTGCTKLSSGCRHCYAERMAKRLQAMGHPNYARGFDVALHEHMLEVPLKWTKPRMIFVNSMSDLFHEDVPVQFIQRVFSTMRQAPHHTFQVLTKRSARLVQLDHEINWPDNVWMGVTVENRGCCFRIDHLRQSHARVKFLSLEPLLGPLPDLDLGGIDWVIEIRDRCLDGDVPFFFKQWGGVRKSETGRVLQGRTWDQVPSPAIVAS
jgi:protein gp37